MRFAPRPECNPRIRPITINIPGSLLEGYRRFRGDRYTEEAGRFRRLSAGQRPATMIIGCADSRVDPSTIFSADPGELFVVRNVAALVPPSGDSSGHHGTSAAIEFAVTGLNVANIVVMGHGMCGGITACLAAADNKPVGSYIRNWVEMLAVARDRVLKAIPASNASSRQLELERLGVQLSIANLLTFPFVSEAVANGKLTINGAWFSIGEGELYWLDRDTGAFEIVRSSV